MIEIVRTLALEDGTDFKDITSFVTKNFIGIWDGNGDRFVLIERTSSCLEIMPLPSCSNLDELDAAVYEVCGEHITAASEDGSYSIYLGAE